MQKKTNNKKKASRVQDIKPSKNPKGGSTGAGAGKVTFNTFNTFSITRKIDSSSPQ